MEAVDQQPPRASPPVFDAATWSARLLGPDHVLVLQRLQAQGACTSSCPVQWRDGDIAFRCQECEVDNQCVVCPECFYGANHAGHTVNLIRTNGGCCDCGDPSSWKPEGFCHRHRGITDQEDSELSLQQLPQDIRETCASVLAEAVAIADGLLVELASANTADSIAPSLEACFNWLRSLGQASFGLRYAMRAAVTPRLTSWIRHATKAGQAHANLMQGFFMGIVQQSPQLKCAFAVAFLELYEELGYDDVSDTRFVVGLTVQFFTVEDVAIAMCRDHNMVERVCGYMLRVLDSAQLEEGVPKNAPVQVQVLNMINDLRYVLQGESVQDWVLTNPGSRAALVSVLKRFWCMNAQKRQDDDHVLYESRVWLAAFRLEAALEGALAPLEAAARRLPGPAARAWYGELLAALEEVSAGVECDETCSFHVRLLRFLTQSLPYSRLLRCLKTESEGAQVPEGEDSLGVWLEVLTPERLSLMLREAARPYIFGCEIRAGLWVRNGLCARDQLQQYWMNWQTQDVLSIQVSSLLLGMHLKRSPNELRLQALEPLRLLWSHALRGSKTLALREPSSHAAQGGASAVAAMRRFAGGSFQETWPMLEAQEDLGDPVRVEAFWEMVGRAVNETWLADICEANKGTPEYMGQAARAALRRWLLHLLAERAANASELEQLLPKGWGEHPAKDDELRAVAVGKVTDRGATKFELKPESWRHFDVMHMAEGQRHSPEAEESAMKHKSDLLGPGREDATSFQEWRDALLEAWSGSGLVPILRDFLRMREWAHRSGGHVPLTGGLPWVLKVLDHVQLARRLGGPGPSGLLGAMAEPADLGLGSPVRLLAPESGSERVDAAGWLGPSRGGDRVAVLLQDGNRLELRREECGHLEGAEAPSWRDDIGAALQALKEREEGVLSHLCDRVLARGRQTLQAAKAQDQEAKQAKRRQMAAARQRAMLQSMATKQHNFMIGGMDDGDDAEEAAEEASAAAALTCDVCREPATAGRPVCLLAHAVRTNALQQLTQHSDFSAEASAVSSCGHVMHANCLERHREHFRRQQRHADSDIFKLSRPGDQCVPCPMCRAIVSICLPVLSAGQRFNSSCCSSTDPVSAAAAGSAQAVAEAVAAGAAIAVAEAEEEEGDAGRRQAPHVQLAAEMQLSRLPTSTGDDFRPALIEACALQLLTTSVISPAKAVPGDGPPLAHAVLLRLLAMLLPHTEPPDPEEDPTQRDPKRALLEALGYCHHFPERFRGVTHRLTQVRARQLLGTSGDLEGLASWLVFAAWVASALWSFEARELNVLAHLPDEAAARVAALSGLVFGVPLDLGLGGALMELSPAPPPMVKVNDLGGLVELAPLPGRLLDLIRDIYKRPCGVCGNVPAEPSICLLCGAIVCAGSETCGADGTPPPGLSPRGSCARHAYKCGASQGLFLSPYWGRVVAVSGTMLGAWEYPYFDIYGEAVPPTTTADLTLDPRRLERLRTYYSTGTIGLEIMRQNQRTSRYMRTHL